MQNRKTTRNREQVSYLPQTLCSGYTLRNAGSGGSFRIPDDIKQDSSLYRLYNGARRKWQAFLSRNECYQEWSPPRNYGLQKSDGHKAFAILPQPRGRQIYTVTAEHYAVRFKSLKRSSPDCAILTTLCSQPFADSSSQKWSRIQIPKWLIKETPQSEFALQGPEICKRST